jgi:hypothetical protein
MDKKNTGIRGDTAVLLASYKLTESGIIILKPMSDCLKFDMVAFDGEKFYKLQIKRAYPAKTKDKFVISLRRVFMSSKGAVALKYSKDDTDFIIGVIVETGDLYCLPIDLVEDRNLITLNPKGIISNITNKKAIDTEPYKNVIALHNTIYKL